MSLFFFQAEDGIRDDLVTGVQTCALPISSGRPSRRRWWRSGERAVQSSVTGLILAGGKGSRMGGVDKGLQNFRGRRLVDHVYERFAPQVGGVVINANQNHEEYKTFGVRVVSDAIGGYAGPLAGVHAGLSVSKRPFLASVPCDSPFLPADLIERLYQRIDETGAELAVAKTGEQPHPVFSLMRRRRL